MPNHGPDDELLARALAGHDCPSLEDLERLLQDGAPAPLMRHVEGCLHCRTELHLLRSFTANEVAEHEKAAVDSITARLRTPSAAAFPARALAADHVPWWKRILAVPWMTPAAATLAVVLVIAGVTLQWRRSIQPALDTGSGGREVLRSSSIAISSPMGDVREKPAEIRWEAVPAAARYRVRIMEVDRTEIWSADATSPRIDLPPAAGAFIVPSKTLLIQVAAFDASGQKIAESEPVRFRLLQNIYKH